MNNQEKLTDSLLREHQRKGNAHDQEFMDSVLQQITQNTTMKEKETTPQKRPWLKFASGSAAAIAILSISYAVYAQSALNKEAPISSDQASATQKEGEMLSQVEPIQKTKDIGPVTKTPTSPNSTVAKITNSTSSFPLEPQDEASISLLSGHGDFGHGWGSGDGFGMASSLSRGSSFDMVARDSVSMEIPGGNKYSSLNDNQPKLVTDQGESTFSIDVDTASYTQLRRSIVDGQHINPDSVRIEELINYFKYSYPQPKDSQPFSINVDATFCPWNMDNKLVRIGLQGKQIKADKRQPANLVFLIDTSGSMQSPDKLPLLQKSLMKLMENMNENDSISIVTYAGRAGVALAPTAVDSSGKSRIAAVLQDLGAGGSTNGAGGIRAAYAQAQAQFKQSGVNRVILATDGDFNVGISSNSQLTEMVKEKAQSGVELSVLGFGKGNLNDAMLESITNNGNGNYYYIDSLQESNRVLTENIGGTLQTIAKDVKIQAIFNPAKVKSFRLIGYANRMLKKEDFDNDRVDAGEIGAGHSVTALYEITTHDGEPNQKFNPDELMRVKLRYKQPKGTESCLLVKQVPASFTALNEASKDMNFSASVALFGMLHRDSKYKGFGNKEMVRQLASRGLSNVDGKARQEFLELVKTARID